MVGEEEDALVHCGLASAVGSDPGCGDETEVAAKFPVVVSITLSLEAVVTTGDFIMEKVALVTLPEV